MPRLTDLANIRRRLETDRVWAIYALGDLTPGFWEHCDWFGAADGSPALILIYRAFDPPVIFAQGRAGELRGVLEEVGCLPKMYLSVRPEFLPVIKSSYAVEHEKAMWRMVVDAAGFRPAPTEGGTHLVSTQESVGAVGNVYTRRDHRGQGLAARTTSAVTAEHAGARSFLFSLRVPSWMPHGCGGKPRYERLGYQSHCAFIEGVAVKR